MGLNDEACILHILPLYNIDIEYDCEDNCCCSRLPNMYDI